MNGRPMKRGDQGMNLASRQGLATCQDENFFFKLYYINLLPKTKRGNRKRRKFIHSIVT